MAKGFKHGAGGGENLNFKVVGGTSTPSNPKENTIWVNTSTAITSWDFSATEPAKRSKNKNMVLVDASTTTKNGVTFTVNSNGSITVNGTASAGSEMRICSIPVTRLLEVGKTYTLKGTGDSNIGIGIHERTAADSWVKTHAQEYSKDVTFTYNGVSVNGNEMYVYLYVPSGRKVSSVIVYPQLEKGSTATSFVKGDATGHVWISTGTSSTAPFNALKKNGIMVYPISAKQYVNDAWVDKEAKIYQNGAWVDWLRYLYNSGNECADLTGGFTNEGYYNSSGSTIIAFTKNSDNLHANPTGGKFACVGTMRAVALTNVKTVLFDMTVSSVGYGCSVFVAKTKDTSTSSRAASLNLSVVTRDVFELDVSTLTGEYYVCVLIADNANVSVYRIWLE